MRRRVGPHLFVAVAAIALVSGTVAAHDLGVTRVSTPIPLDGLYAGAGATVLLTAVLVGWRAESVPTAGVGLFDIPATLTRFLYVASRLAFSAVVVFVAYHGITGPQVAAENVATLFVWPVWLKGVGIVAIVIGSPWRVLSPWRGLHAGLERLEGSDIRARPYPERLGVWPAVLGFLLVVGIVENLTVLPQSPAQTVGLLAAYAALMLGGSLVYGATWFTHADFLEVLYAQFARLAPIHTAPGGTAWSVRLRAPWTGCLQAATRPGMVAFLVAMVYTVTFDGLMNTPEYQTIRFAATDAIGAGFTTEVALYAGGLLAFLASFLVAIALVEYLGASGRGTLEAARAFAPTVVPIAAAYEVAHNYLWVLVNLDRLTDVLVMAIAGPFAGFAPDLPASALAVLAIPALWASQVTLVVAGHVVAVVAAHSVAVARYRSPGRARVAHAPLVLVMVAYTVLSLWIISRPIVTG